MERKISEVVVCREFLGGAEELKLTLGGNTACQRRSNSNGQTFPASFAGPTLNLLSPPTAGDYRNSPEYQSSVCTLEKVKLALERAKVIQSPQPNHAAVSSPAHSSSSSSSITTINSLSKDRVDVDDEVGDSSGDGLTAAGCPSCMMYVMIAKSDPRCPRCDCHVPLFQNRALKRPRFDLNFALGDDDHNHSS